MNVCKTCGAKIDDFDKSCGPCFDIEYDKSFKIMERYRMNEKGFAKKQKIINEKKSGNPFKYGDVLFDKEDNHKIKVIGVCYDVVFYEQDNADSVFAKTFYLLLGEGYREHTPEKNGWVNLNDDKDSPHYWKKWRDKIVWFKLDTEDTDVFLHKLVYYNNNSPYPYVNSRGATYDNCSVYNDIGEKAEFTDE